MMFRREARLPIEADVEQNETDTVVTSEDIDTETTADAFIEKMLKMQEDTKSIAGENIKNLKKSKRSATINGIHQMYIIIQLYTGCMQVYTLAHSCVRMLYVRSIYELGLFQTVQFD